MEQVINRYLEKEPQLYKVVGYSVKPSVQQKNINLKMRVSHTKPLDVTVYLNQLAQVII
ncbi:hypothetical protein [Viridibacillus arvi]|uniref:hypothetical protein n=1 Tax=Viridibacillus arvi TaxID=263475 RepID=UPI0034CF3C55